MGPGGWMNANLRTTFEKIIRRAGLKSWHRPFHNLRASRETELVETYPVQVVTSWLGNSPSVAMKHYLMTTDDHFNTAIRGDSKVAQNPAQQAHAMGCWEPQEAQAALKETPEFPGFAKSCHSVRMAGLAEEGFEPPTRGL